MSTIQRHLNTWRASRSTDSEASHAASVADVVAAVSAVVPRVIAQAVANAKDDLERRLGTAKADLANMMTTNQTLEWELDSAKATIEARTSDRDMLSGQVTALEGNVKQIKAELERERTTAETLRLELAKAEIRVEGAARHELDAAALAAALRAELDRAVAELQRERVACAAATARATAAETSVGELRVHLELVRDERRLDAEARRRQRATKTAIRS